MFCSLEEAWGNNIYKQGDVMSDFNQNTFQYNSAEKQIVQSNNVNNNYQIEHFEGKKDEKKNRKVRFEDEDDDAHHKASHQTCRACNGNGMVGSENKLVNFICGLPDDTVLFGIVLLFIMFFDIRITRR